MDLLYETTDVAGTEGGLWGELFWMLAVYLRQALGPVAESSQLNCSLGFLLAIGNCLTQVTASVC